jgi:fructose-bisphosphate aldolase class II
MKLQELIQTAYHDHFAIGAFNVYNLESVKAVVRAASEVEKPIIIQTSESALEYAGFDYLADIMQRAKIESKAPVFMHLDHGTNVELIKKCLKAGFDSVMFDGSKLPVDQNIVISRDLRKYAHAKGAVFEAEIGRIGGREDKISSQNFKTDPVEALQFYSDVKPDILAVAIGNIHGERTTAEQLDFALLAKISTLVRCPLVLHGCSNRSNREYQVAISQGVVKINIDTELREAFVEGVKRALHKREDNPREILKLASSEVEKTVKEKIEVFSCSKLKC